MKQLLLTSLACLSMMAGVSANANAQEVTVTETGHATGIFYAFYTGERDIEPIPVAYQKYSDGSVTLTGFANGKDLKLIMDVYDEEYNCYNIAIDDCEGVGQNDTFTYEGYEYWPFPVYRFDQPVVISEDKIDFLFMDGSSYYDLHDDTIVLDYTSAVDEDEYMFLIDFTMPFEVEEEPTSLAAVRNETSGQSYDLFGHRVNKAQQGFVIRNGKKMLRM